MTPSVSIAGNLGCVHTVPYSFFAGTKISSHTRTVISARFLLNGEKLCLADLLSGESHIGWMFTLYRMAFRVVTKAYLV